MFRVGVGVSVCCRLKRFGNMIMNSPFGRVGNHVYSVVFIIFSLFLVRCLAVACCLRKLVVIFGGVAFAIVFASGVFRHMHTTLFLLRYER